MTDRIHSVTIVLEKDVRDDAAKELLVAFSLLKGVLSVTPNVSDLTSHMACERAKHDLIVKLHELLDP